MMFKNAMVFLIAPGFRVDATMLTRQIASACGSLVMPANSTVNGAA